MKGIEEKFVAPLENFANYDFLEVTEVKKKLSNLTTDYEATKVKMEGSLSGKTKSRKSKHNMDLSILNEVLFLILIWIFINL